MKKTTKALALAGILGASAIAATSVQAWGGPWGGNMFGMDMGQSTGYGYPGGYRPWGGNMFGMDFGQSAYGYGPYGYAPYYGAPVAHPVVVPQAAPAK